MPRVMVIGSGGREHAICTKLHEDGCEVICAPGSDGIGDVAKIVPITENNFPALLELAATEKIDLTFVGPEGPIVAGIEKRKHLYVKFNKRILIVYVLCGRRF